MSLAAIGGPAQSFSGVWVANGDLPPPLSSQINDATDDHKNSWRLILTELGAAVIALPGQCGSFSAGCLSEQDGSGSFLCMGQHSLFAIIAEGAGGNPSSVELLKGVVTAGWLAKPVKFGLKHVLPRISPEFKLLLSMIKDRDFTHIQYEILTEFLNESIDIAVGKLTALMEKMQVALPDSPMKDKEKKKAEQTLSEALKSLYSIPRDPELITGDNFNARYDKLVKDGYQLLVNLAKVQCIESLENEGKSVATELQSEIWVMGFTKLFNKDKESLTKISQYFLLNTNDVNLIGFGFNFMKALYDKHPEVVSHIVQACKQVPNQKFDSLLINKMVEIRKDGSKSYADYKFCEILKNMKIGNISQSTDPKKSFPGPTPTPQTIIPPQNNINNNNKNINNNNKNINNNNKNINTNNKNNNNDLIDPSVIIPENDLSGSNGLQNSPNANSNDTFGYIPASPADLSVRMISSQNGGQQLTNHKSSSPLKNSAIRSFVHFDKPPPLPKPSVCYRLKSLLSCRQK